MDSEFAKRFPITSMLIAPAESLSEEEFFELLSSLSDKTISQLMSEMIIINDLVDMMELLSPEQIKALSMMANYQNN